VASQVQQLQLAPGQVAMLVRVLKLLLRYLEEEKQHAICQDKRRRELEGFLEIVLEWLNPTRSPAGSGARPSAGRVVSSKYGEVTLSKKAYRLWQLLCSSPGGWWAGEKLSEKLGSKPHAVIQLISRLRDQLRPIRLETRVEAKRGLGWRWAA